jgi:predicted DNA-binding protein (UPF0251 family)
MNQIEITIKMRRRRYRRGQRGRFPKPVNIPNPSKINKFTPQPKITNENIILEPEEIEALRLVDLEGLSQEQAGVQMGVSRGTIWRFLQSAREKVAQALTEGRPIVITPKSDL